MEENRNLAISIIEIFSGFLNDYNIIIPSDDREGEEDESPIYGDAYYRLEDEITEFLDRHCKTSTCPIIIDN